MTAAQQRQLSRMARGEAAQKPIPEIPQLPKFLRERHPDKAAEMDAYDQAWKDFFVKAGVIQG